ncbi:hypothetical protein O4D10_10655 [Xanthomonas citri pv. citri]|uniref:hypothetical protein n=1 Tax=Xanthomonas citri TaxID=346 RepID=UPI0036D85751
MLISCNAMTGMPLHAQATGRPSLSKMGARNAALFTALFATAALLPGMAQAESGKILMIVRNAPPGGSSDPDVAEHLRKQGYQVTMSEGLEKATDVCQYDLVLLSSTVRSNQFTAERGLIRTLRDMRVPLLTWENDLLDDLRYTGLQRDTDFGELETGHYAWMVRAPHPMSAGIPAGLTTWTEARQPAGWGRPGLGADIIMTWPGEPEKSMLFGYQQGATMNHEFLAPARRVFIGMDNNTFAHTTENGRKLFDAAVRWTAQGHAAASAARASDTCVVHSAHSALD